MAILTKPGTVLKGTPANFSLDKDELAAHSALSSDAYFSDNSNWKKVLFLFKSSVGNQSEAVSFDATQAFPVGVFSVSTRARNIFQISGIIISDYDGANFVIQRSQLSPAERSAMDVAF